jgi:hypothetical protein
MPPGKTKISGSLKGAVVNQPRSLSQMTGGLRLDRGPDGERRAELVSVDHQVRPVAHADLVDRVEQGVGSMLCEDVGQAGLDAHAGERQETLLRKARRQFELLVTELDARHGERIGRVGRESDMAMST